jgi:NitT/TauT family transport system permease protein
MSEVLTAEKPAASSQKRIAPIAPPRVSRGKDAFLRWALPLGVAAAFLGIWHAGVRISGSDLFPTPFEVLRGIKELMEKGLLPKYIVASIFRVTWGFTLAVLIGVPFGLLLGWYARAFQAFNPMIQVLRPISPIAWIPVAILWFGVSDAAPVFLIFLASVSRSRLPQALP